ncbi:hypothetical protein J2X06_000613 [Lysobacter niastensis]|uniref:Aerotolerance regulator N-terminal domain-containing protein n=1 Tax=Lysobacter niastensis TaxID=380629 RepID=A0ABU1W781_9GAMM|nr:BatA domain-containing protein [Lysobacter niastensis]MDR7133429.1 hypothetical protein [Lysobacter niastensis]
MNLALLLPAGLAALAALLLPLLIHLARRSEQRPTAFAALRWLRQKPKPRHRIRFDEWPLLIVRLLLLSLLALLLARPVLFGATSEDPWVAVMPGIDLQQGRAAQAPENARRHWLAPGFPSLDASQPEMTASATGASVTSLLRELDASLPPGVALTVLVPAQLDGVDAKRPVLSRRVDWRVVAGTAPTAQAAKAPATNTVPAPVLSVRYAADRETALRYLRAANAAWREPNSKASAPVQDVAPAGQALSGKSKTLVWLAPGRVPQAVSDWIRTGGIALIDAQATLADAPPMAALWRDDTGAPLVEGARYGNGRVMRLTRALTPQALPALLEADFPQHLRSLFDALKPAPARVFAADHAPATGGPVFPQSPRDLQPWLLALIALLFLIERWMASGSRHRVTP